MTRCRSLSSANASHFVVPVLPGRFELVGRSMPVTPNSAAPSSSHAPAAAALSASATVTVEYGAMKPRITPVLSCTETQKAD